MSMTNESLSLSLSRSLLSLLLTACHMLYATRTTLALQRPVPIPSSQFPVPSLRFALPAHEWLTGCRRRYSSLSRARSSLSLSLTHTATHTYIYKYVEQVPVAVVVVGGRISVQLLPPLLLLALRCGGFFSCLAAACCCCFCCFCFCVAEVLWLHVRHKVVQHLHVFAKRERQTKIHGVSEREIETETKTDHVS